LALKCSLRKRLILLTSITVALAADKDKPKLEINAASSYPHHMTSQGMTIAVVPYETEEQAKTAFGKVNPNAQGVLPVLVILENNSPNTIRLERMKLEYTAQGGVRIENTPAQEVRFLRGAREPKMSPGPVGGIHVSRDKNPLNAWEIEGRAFSAKMIPPNDKASGFFYFQTGSRGGATVVVSGLRDARSGEELFFFEIPLR
jgi:hypothetical protein